MLRATRFVLTCALAFVVGACGDYSLIGGDGFADGDEDDDTSPTGSTEPPGTPTATPVPDRDGDTVSDREDCAPDDPNVFQGNKEICDEVDNNCNGLVDEGETHTYFPDGDGDGYGVDQNTVIGCAPPEGYVEQRGDCDDADPTVYPGATDIEGDGVDQDCGGTDAQQPSADSSHDEESEGGDDECPDPSNCLKKLTIQAALDAASPGDTVWIFPGTYPEHDITFRGKAVTLVSTGGVDATFVDAQSMSHVFVFDSEETPLSIMDGFTLGNGSADDGGGIQMVGSSPTIVNTVITSNISDVGGGIFMVASSPILRNVRIYANEGYDGGGGIMMDYSSPVLSGCYIGQNLSYIEGGGIIVGTHSAPTITNTTIVGNTGWLGGGIYVFLSTPSIVNTLVALNTSMDVGGGIYFDKSTVDVANTLVHSNTAVGSGGGIYVYESQGSMVQTVVANNTAELDAGGIYLKGDSTELQLLNSILAYNSSYNLYNATNSEAPATLTSCNLYAPEEDLNVLGIELDASTLTSEPGFLDYDDDDLPKDFHLAMDSPAVDVGFGEALDVDQSTLDLGIFGGGAGGNWDLDNDRRADWFWPGTIEDAPNGFDPADYDCNDADRNTTDCPPTD